MKEIWRNTKHVLMECAHENAKPHSRVCKDCGVKLLANQPRIPIRIYFPVITPDEDKFAAQ